MNRGIVVSLFDFSCVMLEPWRAAGFACYAVDIQHGGAAAGDGIERVRYDLRTPWLPPFSAADVAMVFAFPPCDHLAVSGARWFPGQGGFGARG